MNRLHRLHRSATSCGVAIAVLLLFTVPASRDFVAGQPFFMVALLAAIVILGGFTLLFLHVADKVEAAEQAARPQANTMG